MNHQTIQPMKTANSKYLQTDIKYFNKVSVFGQRRYFRNRGADIWELPPSVETETTDIN